MNSGDILTSFKKYIPPSIKSFLRKYYYSQIKVVLYWPLDMFEGLTGKRDMMTPPRGKMFVGRGDFEKIGQLYLNYFIEHCQLKPNEKILDAGCGIGRMAIPMTSFLSKDSVYCGFDIVKHGIVWCQKNISKNFPHFHFHWADIYNDAYNASGKYLAEEYCFPYKNESFDFVYLTSVFTHMGYTDMSNYFKEISRVLKPGGRCMITFYLLDAKVHELIKDEKTTVGFIHKYKNGFVINKYRPEDAIAYDESIIRDLYTSHGLSIDEPIRYGYWRGENNNITVQDIVIAHKDL